MTEEQMKTLSLLLPGAVPTSQQIVRRGKLPEQLHAEILPSDSVKLLVAGQRGMGKTTELRRFTELLVEASEFLAIFLQFGAQPSITQPGLIYAMGQALDVHPKSKLDPKSFRHFQEWYSREEEVTVHEGGIGGDSGVGGEFLVFRAKGTLHAKSSTAKKKTRKVRRDLRDLLERFNNLTKKARKETGKRVVFVVDDIDKVQDASSIENTFIHASNLIGQIDCPCIFTVPITYATSSYLRIAALPYTGIYRVPAVELLDSEGHRNESAFEFMRKVFNLRLSIPYPPNSLIGSLNLAAEC